MVIRYAFPDNIHDDRNTRTCRHCGETKSVAEFDWNTIACQYVNRCCECRRVQERDRKRHIAALKVKRRRPWTKASTARLRACIVQGMTVEQTAAVLGRSLSSIHSKRTAESLPRFKRRMPTARRRVWLPDRIAELQRLRDSAHTFDECAAILGTTRNGIAGGTRYLKEARP